MPWQRTDTRMPPEGQEVVTKIHDGAGARNKALLTYENGVWWTPGKKFYVYYTPTHWMHKGRFWS